MEKTLTEWDTGTHIPKGLELVGLEEFYSTGGCIVAGLETFLYEPVMKDADCRTRDSVGLKLGVFNWR